MSSDSYLLITADDGGYCDDIDRGIVELAQRGIITGVSGFSSFGRIRLLSHLLNRRAALGIHFNLSSGVPLSKPSLVPSLVDANGAFYSPTPQEASAMLPSLTEFVENRVPLFNQSEIYLELKEQLKAFEEQVGQSPAFATVHHDLDRIETIRDTLRAVVPDLPGRQTQLTVGILAEVLCTFLTEDDSDNSAERSVLAMLDKARCLLSGTRNLLVEIVCHPGYASRQLKPFTVYVDQREREIHAWSSTAVSRFLAKAKRSATGWLLRNDEIP